MAFFCMGKQEKLTRAQPSVACLNSFQPEEGFYLAVSECRQSYHLCRCACRYTGWKQSRASIVHALQKQGWGKSDGNTERSNSFLKISQKIHDKPSVWTLSPPESWVRNWECSGGLPSGALLLLPLMSALSTLSKVFNSHLESRSRDVGVWC